jgi:hypothetical protein
LLKEKFVSHLLKAHPTLSQEKLDELISPLLLSPFHIELPASVLKEAQDFVRACFHLREDQSYQTALRPEMFSRGLKDPGNKAICMSYDFHVDPQGHLKLIEINTNAAFLALGFEMYRMRGLTLPVADFMMEDLKASIETEMQLQGKSANQMRAAIIDEEPEKQRLFAEFLVYQSYFQKWGWPTQIVDYRNLPLSDFVYNRLTDFYFEQPGSQRLREQYLNRSICFSPNPFEYFLLADKQRMIDWSNEDFWNRLSDRAKSYKTAIQKNLPLSKDIHAQTADEIWAERKRFFFKPKRAFGAKQSYRGGSVTRKAFEEAIHSEFIAQEFVPAPELNFQTPDGKQSFKYDLRFYAYQDQVQMVVARLYQGQVTNLKTPYGGFTPVVFK